MDRPRLNSFAVLAPTLLAALVFVVGCFSANEDPLVRQFFRASQLRDNATLANFAAATFAPDKDGVVTTFSITNVSEERRQPLMLKELAQAEETARAADEEFSKKMKAYQDAHLDAIERVLKAEGAKRPVGGGDASVQAAWRKWRDDAATSARSVSEARSKLSASRPVAELSIQNVQGLDAVDLTTVDGQLVSKDVTLDAQVRMPSGDTVQKQLVVTMERTEITVAGKTEPSGGRWVITAIKGA